MSVVPGSPYRAPLGGGSESGQSRRWAPVKQGAAQVTRIADYRPAAPAAPPVRRPDLSDREVEVLLAWLAADSKEEAAEALFISSSTVSTHLARIRVKYTAVGRPAPTKTHLFVRALQDGHTTLDRW